MSKAMLMVFARPNLKEYKKYRLELLVNPEELPN